MIPTGLLGGSFNPAHGGHRAISLNAIDALGLDELWWLVSPGNPLKPKAGMASLPARLGSAQRMARRSPIRATGIEAELGTRYTIDTLKKLVRRYPNRQFIWIMGADNLVQLPQWRDWRGIARLMPIAVIARPGYNDRAHARRAMGWLRRFVRPVDQKLHWTDWRPPALVFLRFSPDVRSATAIRQANPRWFERYEGRALRDPLTRSRLVDPTRKGRI
ncbi:nicotinate-nicotinamide nucleotide adenylyltransferase [Sphingopyxis sp. H038]|uniref:nicotinate-nucleotide adenylyltransferase n=1 Tax=unclassified Sphingopyxis TaxID=2614943 RepID=UPI00072FD181|nr:MULTISPECIES: nicotinate-nucleotide adenylyltransferase [unclassified Sphingopyxis]KTE00276.1 nicotinate-nicotinamide nucleotide adenylyltransferase [Sphingopyxis sp. H012]KTE06443.1 nicotinate-nicotinamide nucleotide adenylyltransferase [Sphingopyxis sp. H053]KTE07264.1 nicotinate-nicotinamide nucleotide adenylyltransferase [Sphingopyxis sp. H093]KTE28861.1 nicotinate-nicotinamide nucleotide adenylyltransferase [Sphingopyxis sp. H080]KTE31636.1 nicotinate-nicotinamide nucleotide adenylyltr